MQKYSTQTSKFHVFNEFLFLFIMCHHRKKEMAVNREIDPITMQSLITLITLLSHTPIWVDRNSICHLPSYW